MSRTGIILFIFLISIAVATGWLKRSVVTKSEQAESKAHAADFFMTHFHMQQFNETGDIAYQLDGTRIEHFIESDTSIISNPDIVVHPKTPVNHWQVSAKRAVAQAELLDEITFEGDVEFNRPAADTITALSLKTEHLLIKPTKEYLTTTSTVTIVGDASTITGENLEADLKQGQLTLHRVTGHYVQ